MTDIQSTPTRVLDNGYIQLKTLANAGPRITHLSFSGKRNLFAELPDDKSDIPGYGEFRVVGGHRLWHAPEALPRTYIPDNDGLTTEDLPGGIRLKAPAQPGTSIAKTIEITLAPNQAAAKLIHTLRNDGLWAVELAPWALSMMRLDGVAILPQPREKTDVSGLLHNRILALWPYSSINDPRLKLRDDFILIHASASMPALKIGYYNTHGWLAYWVDGVLFRKTYDLHPGAVHVDGGCNAEVYCGDKFIELEALGPLTKLAPGASITLTETWELFDAIDQPFLSPEIQALLTAG